jgi:MFS family permease
LLGSRWLKRGDSKRVARTLQVEGRPSGPTGERTARGSVGAAKRVRPHWAGSADPDYRCTIDPTENDVHTRRNITVLILAQAVLGAQLPVNIILGGLAGALLAPSAALATLPISIIVLVSMFTVPMASLFMGRFGRRAGFVLGTAAGGWGAALATFALLGERFEWLLLGAVGTGIYQSFQGFFRFAAADAADPAFKPKAISWVLAGGLISALLGPEIVRTMADAMSPTPYAGAYASLIAINGVGAIIVSFLRIPRPPRREPGASHGRPLALILREPRVVTAVVCAMVSYAVMNLVMTSTPLAMVAQGFTTDHAANVVRWHVLAMFAPSFVTGNIIARLGHLPVIGIGLLLLGACSLIALAGVELHHFYLALIALGFGWNFGFIGATSLLGTTHSDAEQAKVQGLNDFLVFGLVSVASFSSGALMNLFGWNAVQLAVIPTLLVAVAAIAWGRYVRRGSVASIAGVDDLPDPAAGIVDDVE